MSARYKYMVGVLEGLRAHSGRATPSQMYGWLIGQGLAELGDLATIQKDGGSRFKKEVRWARKELFDAGLIGASEFGAWPLTKAGALTALTVDDARAIVRVNARLRRNPPEPATDHHHVAAPPPGPTTGPAPASWSGEVTRDSEVPACTYLLEFGSAGIWKVGHARQPEERLREINKHIPVELLGSQWELRKSAPWPTSSLAYRMEQALLSLLTGQRTSGERISCRREQIENAWNALAPAQGS